MIKMSTYITYLTGGLLGDFIHSLSVCKSLYDSTGKKAVILISDEGDKFRFGAKQAFEDVQELLLQQPYVQSCHVYDNVSDSAVVIDINLTTWRSSPLLFRTTWDVIYNEWYQITNWGKQAWLRTDESEDEANTIYFNMSIARFVPYFPFHKLMQLSKRVVFLCFHQNEAEAFFAKSNIRLDVRVVKDAQEMACRINNSYGFIGNLSSPLAICIACHKYCLALLGPVGNNDAIHMKLTTDQIANYHYWCDDQHCTKTVDTF